MPTTMTGFGDFIQAGIQLINDFQLMPVVLAGAVVSVGMYLFRRARSAAR